MPTPQTSLRIVALGTVCALLACTTPLERGERRYRSGDRLGALEIWRAAPADSPDAERTALRIEAVEHEFEQLVVRYKKRGRYYERQDRLAESILSYRLALRLEDDDRESLRHVQELARVLGARKRSSRNALGEALADGELRRARSELAEMRKLDPFDSKLETVERQLDDALRAEVDRLLARGRRGFTSGNYRAARNAFGAVLDLDPENDSARGYLSYMQTIGAQELEPGSQGSRPPQLTASENEIRAEGHHQNALAAERNGDPYAAIRRELRALQLNPEHQGARRNLARLRGGLQPEVAALIERGRGHFEEEELQSALDQWRRALLIEPRNAQALEYVGRAETLLENLEELRSEPLSSGER
jgi:tetratricopeptide (TPR) repeat protein